MSFYTTVNREELGDPPNFADYAKYGGQRATRYTEAAHDYLNKVQGKVKNLSKECKVAELKIAQEHATLLDDAQFLKTKLNQTHEEAKIVNNIQLKLKIKRCIKQINKGEKNVRDHMDKPTVEEILKDIVKERQERLREMQQRALHANANEKQAIKEELHLMKDQFNKEFTKTPGEGLELKGETNERLERLLMEIEYAEKGFANNDAVSINSVSERNSIIRPDSGNEINTTFYWRPVKDKTQRRLQSKLSVAPDKGCCC